MQRVIMLIVLLIIGAGAIWFYNDPQIHDTFKEYVENGDIRTLEARYTAEQIMALHRSELLGNSNRVFQEPLIKFYPYLVMEAKFVRPNQKTGEGTILWSLTDGEMVLNTETWEKTHGFQDAIEANASPSDFKIINTLASPRYNGTITRDRLQSELNTDLDTLDKWIESAKNKHLVTTKGNEVTLHFQNPKILVDPVTNIKNWIVTKPYEHQQRVTSKYSKTQLEKVAKAAFGDDFSIRTTSEVFLPVYAISVLNPDGSLMTSYWNAINGERLP